MSSKKSSKVGVAVAGVASGRGQVPTCLGDEAIARELVTRPEWSQPGDSIQRTIFFKTFVEAMGFVGKVAELAERAKHHPDILIRYNKVTLTLNTHDAGGITGKDFALASEIDALAPATPAE